MAFVLKYIQRTNLEKTQGFPLTPIDSLCGFYMYGLPSTPTLKHCSVLVPSFLLLPTTPAFMRAPTELRGGGGGLERHVGIPEGPITTTF